VPVSRYPLLGAALLSVALTVILTWPQALHLSDRVAAHGDAYLSMWRVSWVAHALRDDVRHLFDGNIFYPHARTLAYSDATLLEGLLAAPWLWAHANPVLVYNMLLLGGIASSGVGMFVLVRHLTGSADAALVSSAIFTLTPYRIEHFMHLELQWTMWMPLALWSVHRTFDTGSIRFGLLSGALLSLQALSCLYYGAFLGLTVTMLIVLLAASHPRSAKAALGPLCLGAILPMVVAALYAQPYLENAREIGTRSPTEIASFSGQLASYLVAPQQNWAWGWTAFQFGGNELHLFPGTVPVALAAVALVRGMRSRSRVEWIYLALVAISVELSLGFNGSVYRWLHGHLWAVHGFRAPARFAIVACCGLAVLAGFGFKYLNERISVAAIRRTLLVTVLVVVGLECGSAPMLLTDVPRQVPDIYRFLKGVDRSVVIELPIDDWGLSPVYMFWSTWHWRPLVNGYSGVMPPDYFETVARMGAFPGEEAIERLHSLNVRYILVHEAYYKQEDFAAMMLQILRQPELIPTGHFRDSAGNTHVFELKKH
jgi:hypothetical protein